MLVSSLAAGEGPEMDGNVGAYVHRNDSIVARTRQFVVGCLMATPRLRLIGQIGCLLLLAIHNGCWLCLWNVPTVLCWSECKTLWRGM